MKENDKKKAAKKAQMTRTQLKYHKDVNKMAVRKHRISKKTNQPETPTKVYKTPQSIGKAKSRIKTFLPKSPLHKKELILSLAKQFCITCKVKNTSLGNKSLSSDTIQKVKSFYLETSWTCPGKKDAVIVRENNAKEKKQKHFMLTTLREAYTLFKIDNPEMHIGFLKFCEHRRQEVKLIQDVQHSSCLCVYHENVRLLMVALNKYDKTFPTDFHDFIGEIVCNQKNEACMFGECTEYETITCLKPETNHNDVSWWYWGQNENSKVEKQQLTGTLVECYNELATRCPFFLRHTFIKRMQASAFQEERESVKNDATKLLSNLTLQRTTPLKCKMQSSHHIGYQSSLLILLFAHGRKIHVTHLSLRLITCHMTNMLY